MTRAEYYRARASEAEEAAKEVHQKHLKEGFLKTARQWRELADQVERIESK